MHLSMYPCITISMHLCIYVSISTYLSVNQCINVSTNSSMYINHMHTHTHTHEWHIFHARSNIQYHKQRAILVNEQHAQRPADNTPYVQHYMSAMRTHPFAQSIKLVNINTYTYTHLSVSLPLSLSLYIYIYREREREMNHQTFRRRALSKGEHTSVQAQIATTSTKPFVLAGWLAAWLAARPALYRY